jgi:hypothetical protein
MTVISLRGEPMLETTHETPVEVLDILHEAESAAMGETHTAVALVLVDKQGRTLRRIWGVEGTSHALIGSLSALIHKLLTEATKDG